MSELESILKQINESLDSTSESIDKLKAVYGDGTTGAGDEVRSKIERNILNGAASENVSLLSLKNGSMLGYVSSLLMVIGNKLDVNTEDETCGAAREKAIESRVVLERGVKPLEKKLGYQLDKLTRAYTRIEKEYLDAEARTLEKSHSKKGSDGSDKDAQSESDSSSDEELSYRPNAAGLTKSTKTSSRGSKAPINEESLSAAEESEGEDKKGGVYKPPKITAMLPPQQRHFEDKFNAQEHKDRSNRSRMQAMEEYVKESSEQPDWESSIGANIVNHGRGGIKSLRDTEKERKVTTYEEDNFTRLNTVGNKLERRKQKQRERMAKVNMIGGEDFSIFNSKRKFEDSTSRRGNKKSHTAWDRAKRKI
ncbi:hypothetical protein TPHA_0H00440 [Tetrapisispora phaffii CBS 4417]|uniref:Uncharacterized protein n=1 Tax=Tetrapisispora phaffii (strain ATCC 24235 / CBS 4417 / NBRC 1672 / NRRL Y-8282 / UCD 70-5) TaxID=1071381 RepID=G8BWV0_TETPH|nr:hypothetical protein TPHA_0H00440 [Tetrapisispora phaffii CBS 4417]CCE64254.1 hypothetical protein TPHA_0H00440 [Tetrapisispora phaffii CBS 4417]